MAKSKLKISRFHVAEYLDNEEVIAEYLRLAAKERDPRLLRAARRDVLRARLARQWQR